MNVTMQHTKKEVKAGFFFCEIHFTILNLLKKFQSC